MNFVVLDTDPAIHQVIITVLKRHSPGAQFSTATSLQNLHEVLQGQDFNGVISGLSCEDSSGLDLIAHLETVFPGMNILFFCETEDCGGARTAIEERGHLVVGRDIYSSTLTPILSAYVEFKQTVRARSEN